MRGGGCGGWGWSRARGGGRCWGGGGGRRCCWAGGRGGEGRGRRRRRWGVWRGRLMGCAPRVGGGGGFGGGWEGAGGQGARGGGVIRHSSSVIRQGEGANGGEGGWVRVRVPAGACPRISAEFLES